MYSMTKQFRYSVISLIIIGGVFWAGRTAYVSVTEFVADEERKFDSKILVLQKQIAALGGEVTKITGENIKTALSLQEIQNRQDIKTKSQSELLTEAVAKVSPPL